MTVFGSYLSKLLGLVQLPCFLLSGNITYSSTSQEAHSRFPSRHLLACLLNVHDPQDSYPGSRLFSSSQLLALPRLALFLPYYSVQFSHPVVSNSLQPNGLQHTRPPCPSPTPGAYSNSRPSSWWYHPTVSFSVAPFSSCLQSFPASGSFPRSQSFTSGGQSIGALASASVLPVNIQDWFPLGLTGFPLGLISL